MTNSHDCDFDCDFGPSPASFQGLSPVTSLGVLTCVGADAASFLHNQLSNDIIGLEVHEARMAVFCNAKGRMQASMQVYRESNETFFLVLPLTLLAQTLKRLSMFVLRAKVKITDASEQFEILVAMGLSPRQLGLASEQATESHMAWRSGSLGLLGSAFWGLDTPQINPDIQTGFWVQLYPALEQTRTLFIKSKGLVCPKVLNDLTVLPSEAFALSEILSGVATIDLSSFEQFVPQMLNMESIGAVNFKKGCYPGQEVVARSQFRGTLKRRALIIASHTELKAGQDLFDWLDPREPCAQVVQVTEMKGQNGETGLFWAIACFSVQSLNSEESEFALSKPASKVLASHKSAPLLWSKHLGSSAPDQVPHHIALSPLPYALLEDL